MTAGLGAFVPDRALDATLAAPIISAERAALAILIAALLARTDTLDDADAAIPAMEAELRRLLSVAALSRMLTSSGASLRSRSSSKWSSAWRRATGLDAQPSELRGESADVSAWVTDNTTRLNTLVNTAGTRTAEEIGKAIRSGRTPESLAVEFRRVGLPVRNGRLRGRGTFIARDQLSTLAGTLAQRQQTSAGVTHYLWRTVKDTKVRETHADREGKRFAWASPPAGGPPGAAFNCRCHAEAVVDFSQLPRRARSA